GYGVVLTLGDRVHIAEAHTLTRTHQNLRRHQPSSAGEQFGPGGYHQLLNGPRRAIATAHLSALAVHVGVSLGWFGIAPGFGGARDRGGEPGADPQGAIGAGVRHRQLYDGARSPGRADRHRLDAPVIDRGAPLHAVRAAAGVHRLAVGAGEAAAEVELAADAVALGDRGHVHAAQGEHVVIHLRGGPVVRQARRVDHVIETVRDL